MGASNIAGRLEALASLADRLQAMQADGDLLRQVEAANPWFRPALVRAALGGLIPWLQAQVLRDFAGRYAPAPTPLRVGIIMAGNVPLVGFHDLLCTWLSGHLPVVKPSGKDSLLVSALLRDLPPELPVSLASHIAPGDIDLLIATGSDNTARYIRHSYGAVPTLLRANRFSVAVLDGSESPAQLQALAGDILCYHGMGCRSVSALLVPPAWDPAPLESALDALPDELLAADWERLVRYEAAEMGMLADSATTLGQRRILLQEAEGLGPARLGRLRVLRIAEAAERQRLLEAAADRLQVVVGAQVPFGAAQQPAIDDFADGVDTMAWLTQPTVRG